MMMVQPFALPLKSLPIANTLGKSRKSSLTLSVKLLTQASSKTKRSGQSGSQLSSITCPLVYLVSMVFHYLMWSVKRNIR